LVLSSNGIGLLPIKLVAPITDWKVHFEQNVWHGRIEANMANGLTKVSAVDALQIRAVDTRRFIERSGDVSQQLLDEVLAALALVVEI
jgi:mRNA interferase MazF